MSANVPLQLYFGSSDWPPGNNVLLLVDFFVQVQTPVVEGKDSGSTFPASGNRQLKGTERGDWEAPPLYFFPQ